MLFLGVVTAIVRKPDHRLNDAGKVTDLKISWDHEGFVGQLTASGSGLQSALTVFRWQGGIRNSIAHDQFS